MAKSIGELSVFVDESGSFDSSLEPSRFYIVTLLCHDQAEDIKPLADELESQLGYLGYPDTCIHAGPLLRREEDFRAVEIETRRKLFGRMLAFTRKLPVSYLSLVVDKQEHTTPEAISEELKRQLGDFIGRPENPLVRARKIKLYYDDEQDQVKDLLKTSFARLPVEFKADVLPDKYRLFQAADLICTIELLAIKHEKNLPLNKSEEFFFGKWRDLKKNYLAPLRRLSVQERMTIGGLLKIEIASIRANLLPIVVLWGLAGAAVAAYYLMPGVAGTLKVFADWQVEYGKAASFANRFVCGGVVPGLFLLTMPSIRPKRAVATVLAQSVWCGLMGIAVDVFFTLQGVWFGPEPSLGVAVVKTLVDQFGFCVLFVTPLNALFYAWVGNGFSFRRNEGGMTRDWFVRSYLGNIVMNWAITIPALVAVYLFPMELQITVSGFIGATQALLFIFIGRKA